MQILARIILFLNYYKNKRTDRPVVRRSYFIPAVDQRQNQLGSFKFSTRAHVCYCSNIRISGAQKPSMFSLLHIEENNDVLTFLF